LHRVWQELGPARDIRFVDHPALLRLDLPDVSFTQFTDPDQLEDYLIDLGPEDEDVIRELIQTVRDYVAFDNRLQVEWNLPAEVDPKREREFQSKMKFWNTTPMSYFLERLKSPKLRKILNLLYGPGMPLFMFILPIAYASQYSAGYPLGGSLEFARSIERRYMDLGGHIEYQSRVEKILIENGRAVGLRLENGLEFRGENVTVISTADLHATMYCMLPEEYLSDEARAWFEHVPVIGSPLQVTVGVNMPIRETPSTISGVLFEPASPITLYGKPLDMLNIQVFDYDPGTAPLGKTVIRVNLSGDFDFWKQLQSDTEGYTAEKTRIAMEVIAALDGRYPGLAARVEMIDVATPVTYERYTGNWRGSSQGWVPTPEASAGRAWFSGKTLPGLGRFYLAGQWVESIGGVPSAALSARMLIHMICQRDGKTFQTQVV
jgi:phytoene dehydrogenase-like protein